MASDRSEPRSELGSQVQRGIQQPSYCHVFAPSHFASMALLSQVPRILNPVVAVLDQLPQMYKDEDIKLYIDSSFGV